MEADLNLNRIQIKIFEKLSKDKGLAPDDFIKEYSCEFIGVPKERLEDLSEEEGDVWINKAYLMSLG